MGIVICRILSEGKETSPAGQLLSIEVHKELNAVSSAELIYFVEQDLDINKGIDVMTGSTFDHGNRVEILLSYEGEREKEKTIFTGSVVQQKFESGGFDNLDIGDLQSDMDNLRKEIYDLDSKVNRLHASKSEPESVIKETVHGNVKVKELLIRTTEEKFEQDNFDNYKYRNNGVASTFSIKLEGEVTTFPKTKTIGPVKHRFEYGISDLFTVKIENTRDQLNQRNKNIAAHIASTNLKSMSPVHGEISVPGSTDLQVLDVIELSGFSKHFDGKTLITGIRHKVAEDGWITYVRFGG